MLCIFKLFRNRLKQVGLRRWNEVALGAIANYRDHLWSTNFHDWFPVNRLKCRGSKRVKSSCDFWRIILGWYILKMRQLYRGCVFFRTVFAPAVALLTTGWHCRPTSFESVASPPGLRRRRERAQGRTVFNMISNDPNNSNNNNKLGRYI